MTKERSKRCKLLLFIFIVKCFKKPLLIRILKQDNQLHLFQRLEQCSKKQINCHGSIEFLHLCQEFDVTPTFARVDQDKHHKWKHSSESFAKNVLAEELRQKKRLNESLSVEIDPICD